MTPNWENGPLVLTDIYKPKKWELEICTSYSFLLPRSKHSAEARMYKGCQIQWTPGQALKHLIPSLVPIQAMPAYLHQPQEGAKDQQP